MKVRVYATLRPIVGGREIELDLGPEPTVRGVVDAMIARWPELESHLLDDGALSRRAHVFVEGRSARHLPDGEKTVITTGQSIDVSPAVAGG
jgi:molybdopterin converting factor small subunit